MEVIYTNDDSLLKKWDVFIMNDDRCSHLMLPDWIASYHSYGFKTDVCLCLVDGEIIGGFSGILAKAAGFRFYIVPFGPIVSRKHDFMLDKLIAEVPKRARNLKACYAQINLPINIGVDNPHLLNVNENLASLNGTQPGHIFNYIYSPNGLNWIDLKGYHEESKIMTLKPAVRRNIRNSYRKGLEFKIMESKEKLAEAYRLFGENAAQANYNIREWNDINQTLFSLQEKGHLKMLAAYKDNVLKGAIMLVKAGGYYTYILGGSKKEVPDLRTGDFLQWEAIKLSLFEGLDGYNISLGGSKGVVEFKNSFNTQQILFENGKFNWVISPSKFALYKNLEKFTKPHKKIISKMLSLLKRKK
jgi:lipid II:glycine glycyltransferase (peptidoglycan interpeptide bridge formation enzyme)